MGICGSKNSSKKQPNVLAPPGIVLSKQSKSKMISEPLAPTTPNDLKVGQSDFINETFGNFRDHFKMGTVLGTGASGEVRRCQHRITGVQRAVKILRKDALDREEIERFLYEIEILRKLDHPNIVRLYEFFQDDKRFYLITELCTGGELFDEIVKRSHFSEKEAASIIKQVLSAVAYCHNNNIAHRDLKPENLLFDNKTNLNLKVIDFGTSQRFDPTTRRMKQTFGTPYYIAPEVLRADYNEKCDIWSCGVILFVLLSGTPPFGGKDDREILSKVKNGQYKMGGEVWDSISKEAIDLIKRMLIFDPAKRISASEALMHPWIKKSNSEDPELTSTTYNALKNLQNFRAEQKLQQATLTFIVSQLVGKDEMAELEAAFKALDKNSDGKLTREELIEGYRNTMGPIEVEELVDGIMAVADADGNGAIEYSEFVTATINKKKALSHEKLEAAFNLFDQDKSGFISASELKVVFGTRNNLSEDIFKQMINEVDENGDGEISFKEFQAMMEKILN